MESAVCNVPSDSVDAAIRGMKEEEGEPSIKDQEGPLHETKIEVGEESPTNTQQPAEFIVHEAASTGNCWDSVQRTEDAATQELKEEDGGLSDTVQQDSLNEKKVEPGKQLTVNDAHQSFVEMVANEIASIRNCWNFRCSEEPEAGKRPLDKESQDLNFKTETSAACGTSNREPEDLKMGMMREKEDWDDEVLVTQDDSGESDEELEFSCSTAMNGVSQTLSPGRSVVKTKKQSLSDDRQASEPAERVEDPQKNPNPFASAEPGESFTDSPSPYLPESQNAGKSDYDIWFQSYQIRGMAAVHAAWEASSFNESMEQVCDSPVSAQHHKAPTMTNSYECPECKKPFSKAHSLNQHRRTAHQEAEVYQCTKCAAHFSLATQLMHHQCTVHNMERRYSCPYCTETFSKIPLLNKHRRTHMVRYNSQCDKSFKEETSLREHERSHFWHHPKCTQCNALGKMIGDLKKHKKSDKREGGSC